MNDPRPIPTDSLYTYRARCVKVVDGDTLDVVLDQGMHNTRTERLRLLGVNCPEMRGESRIEGKEAKSWVERLIWNEVYNPGEWPLLLRTEKADAFGRYLAHVWRLSDGLYINQAIIDAGHGVVY